MNDRVMWRLLWLCAGVTVAAGVGLSARTAGRLEGHRAKLDRKVEVLAQATALANTLRRYEGAKALYAQLPPGPTAPLDALIEEAGFDRDKLEIRVSREPCVPGWSIRHEEIALGDVALSEVMRFVFRAEQRRPPRLLTSCVIKASPHGEGRGQVVLRLSGPVRSGD